MSFEFEFELSFWWGGLGKDARAVAVILTVRVQLVPRTGFEAKKKELHAFKNAIEMYEADPEMNPISIVQV